MNYLKEMNAFIDWLETNPLESSTQTLWFHLMAVANKSGWPEWFTVANSLLQAKVCVTENTLDKHRNKLVQKGRIKYSSQGKKKAGKYHMVSLLILDTSNIEVKSEVNNNITSNIEVKHEAMYEAKYEVNREVKGTALFKRNETKQNDDDEDATQVDIPDDEINQKAHEIEMHFCQKRAKGFNVSSIDFQLMREIAAYGISIESAKQSIDSCFSEYVPKHPRDAISTFSYCVSRCYDDWAKLIERSKPIQKINNPPNKFKARSYKAGFSNKPNLPIIQDKAPVAPLSEERREAMRKKAAMLDGAKNGV